MCHSNNAVTKNILNAFVSSRRMIEKTSNIHFIKMKILRVK